MPPAPHPTSSVSAVTQPGLPAFARGGGPQSVGGAIAPQVAGVKGLLPGSSRLLSLSAFAVGSLARSRMAYQSNMPEQVSPATKAATKSAAKAATKTAQAVTPVDRSLSDSSPDPKR